MSKILWFIVLFISVQIGAQTGIGTTAPVNKLQVETTVADPATSGVAANGNLRLSGTSGSHVLDFGLSSTATYAWIQARLKSNYSNNYNLILNPNGGNVGIGTTNPTAKLNIVGGGIKIHNGFSNTTARPSLTNTSIGNYEIRGVGSAGGTTPNDAQDDGFLRLSAGGGTNNNTQASIDISGYSTVADMNSNIVFRTAGTERLRMDSNGNIGVGTNSPSVRLHVAGDIIANSIAGSSDARFKTNSSPIFNSLQKVMQLQGVTFDWNTKDFPNRAFSEKRSLGFIAQEVEKVIPEVVQTENTSEGFKSVEYDKLVALLVEAIKEQQKQIDQLKTEVNQLKKNKK